MPTTIRRWVVVLFVTAFIFGWSAQSSRDVAVAQGRKPIMMTRIYTGPDGLSHAEEVEMKLNGNVTEMMKATGAEFSRRAPGPVSAWHVGPRRQFVITLSGRGELVVGDGKRVAVGPGQINLIEDTTGKGHTTQNVGSEDRIVVTIPLADQAVNNR
ncbi:MAG: cupin domain-containing protein [Acidobacteria bacterium]|nr:cupin domain-containing protein [Acidobacteriota bacterium]